MRILVISNIFPPGFIGGYELGALDIVLGLRKRGHDVRVITSDYMVDDENSLSELAVVRTLECVDPGRASFTPGERLRRGLYISPSNLRRIGSELIRFQPESVLVFNSAGIGSLGLARLLVASGIHPVFYLMDDVFRYLRSMPRERETARCVFGNLNSLNESLFVILSRTLRAEVEESLGSCLEDVTIVPAWVDPNRESDLPVPTLRDEKSVRFVFASRLAGHKGVDDLIDAIGHLRDINQTDFSLDVIGDGEVAPFLQRVVAKGLSDYVHYCGVLPKVDLARRLAEYDALVLPSWEREPFGFVVPEAAAAGCIPMMTAGIGAGEWFFDGVDCIKFRRHFSTVASAMLQIILMSPTDRLAFRKRCQNTAMRFLRFDSALKIIESTLYRSVTERFPSARFVRAAEAALVILDDLWKVA